MPLDTVHPNQMPENQPKNAIAGFARTIRPYFQKFSNDKFIMSERARLSEFTAALNAQLQSSHREATPALKLRESDIEPILKGVNGPKSMAIVEAMHQTFHIFGDEREMFRAAGARAVKEERERPAQEALQFAQQRKRNPQGKQDKPSFQEMLETSVAMKENFNQFLFGRVMPTWELNQVQFCEHLAKLNENNTDGKATLTDTVLSNWHLGKAKPLRDSVDVMLRAFDIKPEAGQSMAEHERMLWKTIQRLSEYEGALSQKKKPLSAVIEEAKETGNHGDLITRLIDDSGVRYERLKEVLNTHQIAQWKNGARIEDINTARAFLDIVHPQRTEGAEGKISDQNREILSIITGRKFDFRSIIEQSAAQGNPAGALFGALTGRTGMVTLRPQEIIDHFKTKKIELNDRRVRKMRNSETLPRGGRISEADGEAIIELLEQSIPALVEAGIVTPPTDAQKKAMLDMLTGIAHPKDMLKSVIKGEMTAGEMVAKTCERRNIAQSQAEESLASEVGLSHLSNFITGKANLEPDSATKIADWYQKNYKFTPTEQRQFVALARGVKLDKSADDILDAVRAGEMPRAQGLREIYDRSGLSRSDLAAKAGVEHHAVQYSTTETSGGRIILPADSIKEIGKLCGISAKRLDDFADSYSGLKVARKSIRPEDMKDATKAPDESWQDHADTRDKSAGWARASDKK